VAELQGIRVRAVALVIVAALVTGSGLLLDRAVGPKGSTSGPPAAGPSGALFCPHGGHDGWEGWVVVTNPGNRRVRVRLTQLGKEGRRSVATFSVGPLRQVYRQVSADDPADATEVEYFGGWVGAGAILSTGSGGELAAERCEQAAHRNWSILDVPTATGQSSYLVVMNPFDEPAEFDVVLRTEKREVAAGALTPYVLAPQHSVGIAINDYVLQDPDEESLVARVIQRMGRVIAGGLESSSIGIRAEVGLPVSSTRWLIPAGGDAGTRHLVVLNNGASRADLTAVAEAATGQRLVSGPEGFTVGPGEAKTFEPERVKDSGLLVASSNDRPVLAALRVNGSAGDSATLSGTTSTSATWLVLPALPPSGGRSFLLVQNPGRGQVDVTFQVIGSGGSPPPIRPRTMLSGRTIRIPLPSEAGRPVSVLVRAKGGTIVAATASYSPDRRGYAATLGLPMK
jgi:Family of unknown function (DUF5719)